MNTDAPLRPEPARIPAHDTPAARLPDDGPPPPRFAGRAPARPTPLAAFHSVSAVTAVLLALVAIGAALHEPVLIPPLAASAALVHAAPPCRWPSPAASSSGT